MIILIAPTVMAAAFQLRTADDGPYDSIATVALVSCTAIQAPPPPPPVIDCARPRTAAASNRFETAGSDFAALAGVGDPQPPSRALSPPLVCPPLASSSRSLA